MSNINETKDTMGLTKTSSAVCTGSIILLLWAMFSISPEYVEATKDVTVDTKPTSIEITYTYEEINDWYDESLVTHYLDNESSRILREEMKDYPLEDITAIADVAFTLWCEDRSSRLAMGTVMSVIHVRSKQSRFPDTYRGVVRDPAQFTCMGATGYDPIRNVTEDYEEWRTAVYIAIGFTYRNFIPNTTADHYWAESKVSPSWADSKHGGIIVGQVGDHVLMTLPW